MPSLQHEACRAISQANPADFAVSVSRSRRRTSRKRDVRPAASRADDAIRDVAGELPYVIPFDAVIPREPRAFDVVCGLGWRPHADPEASFFRTLHSCNTVTSNPVFAAITGLRIAICSQAHIVREATPRGFARAKRRRAGSVTDKTARDG
jgi:hypothetical protein